MLEGGECLVGERDEILTEKNLSQAYGCSISTAFNGERKLFYPEQNNSD
jgi:ABC-type cobalamin transport system ATPase subunit